MRQKIFVVEGRSDESKLKQIYPDIKVVITNGSAIDQDALKMLLELQNTHDIVLFLDPDYAGERIRKILDQKLNKAEHAFLEKKDAYSKSRKKIGIEHATKQTIVEALKNMHVVDTKVKSDITALFLYEMKLTGSENSKKRRDILTDVLKIGHVNGKTLFARLHMFGINKKQVIEVLSGSSS